MKGKRLFVVSPYLHWIINKKGKCIIWHSLAGNPIVVSKSVLDFLLIFSTPKTLEDALARYTNQSRILELFYSLKKIRFINFIEFDERLSLERIIERRNLRGLDGSFIDYLELRVSETCNFNCSYCILKNAERINRTGYKKFMDFETAKKAIDIYISLLKRNGKKKAEITFGGAEPTLNWSLIEKCVEYMESTYGDIIKLVFYINTNFSLFFGDRFDFIKKHKIKISPSIDGYDAQSNDSTRKTKSKHGTFNDIMEVVHRFNEIGVKIPDCSTTTNEDNFKFVNYKLIDWAKKEHFEKIHINIDVMNATKLDPVDVANRLIRLVHYAKRKKMFMSGFWRRPAENISYSLINNRTGFCGATRGDNLAVDPLGDIYSCGYSDRIIGSVHNFISFFEKDGPYHSFLREISPIATEFCHGCEIEGYCGGGCLATREFNKKNNNPEKVKQMCVLYKTMTRNLLKDQIYERR